MFALSLVCHLLVLLLLMHGDLLPKPVPEEAPVYVDVVTLPVASPQEGTPAPAPAPPAAAEAGQAPEEPAAVALPQPKRPTPPTRKAAPAPIPKAPSSVPAPRGARKPAADSTASEESSFEDRMAKLERAAEERRQSEVLDRLRKKGSGSGARTGIPGAKGTEAGSDYSSYIQSRLRDAFRSTIASETKAPRVVLRLTIGADGHITRYRLEQSTGDRLFEDAVDRAVHLAERSFRPPPNGGEFEQGFVFRPQGVGVR